MKYLAVLTVISLACTLYVVAPKSLSGLLGGGGGQSSDPTDSDASRITSDGPLSADSNWADGRQFVLMKFGATWCPPCRAIDAELNDLRQADMPLTIRKIDVDQEPELADRYDISSIPRLILLQDGKKVGDLTGFRTAAELESWVKESVTNPLSAADNQPADVAEVHANPYFE